MNKVLSLLRDVRPDVDFLKEKSLVDDGVFDSVDVMSIVSKIKDEFGIVVSLAELDPDDFNSAETIFALIERKRHGDKN